MLSAKPGRFRAHDDSAIVRLLAHKKSLPAVRVNDRRVSVPSLQGYQQLTRGGLLSWKIRSLAKAQISIEGTDHCNVSQQSDRVGIQKVLSLFPKITSSKSGSSHKIMPISVAFLLFRVSDGKYSIAFPEAFQWYNCPLVIQSFRRQNSRNHESGRLIILSSLFFDTAISLSLHITGMHVPPET
jgi:hypothetical protein